MKSLADLMNSAKGVSLLESNGVYVDQEQFVDQLKRPAKPNLAGQFGAGDAKLVCSGQQVYVDYQQSVLSKIESLRQMERDASLYPFFLWVDTDRSGSDNLVTKFAWPGPSKKGYITILPPGTREVESRFAPIDSAQLSSAIGRLETHLRSSGQQVEGAKDKYLQMRAIFTNGHAGAPLSAFNLELTDFLLCQVLGYSPRSLVLSDQLDSALVIEEIDLFINRIDDVVEAFNRAGESLVQSDINPQVKPLKADYLPLFYSCIVDNRRLRLHHHIDGADHYAVSRCKCGREYRFYLGTGRLSIAEIARTGRWSPDVCFPIFFNDQVSGYVAGKSSAIYLLILNAVMREVLGKTPVPILVPESLRSNGSNGKIDSLIYRYFSGT